MAKLYILLQIISVCIPMSSTIAISCNYRSNCTAPISITTGHTVCIIYKYTCSTGSYNETAVSLYGLSATGQCGYSASYEGGCTGTYSCCYSDFCNTCPSPAYRYYSGYESSTSSYKSDPATDGIQIAGIVIGIIVALIITCFCCYRCLKGGCSTPKVTPEPRRGHWETKEVRVWVTD